MLDLVERCLAESHKIASSPSAVDLVLSHRTGLQSNTGDYLTNIFGCGTCMPWMYLGFLAGCSVPYVYNDSVGSPGIGLTFPIDPMGLRDSLWGNTGPPKRSVSFF